MSNVVRVVLFGMILSGLVACAAFDHKTREPNESKVLEVKIEQELFDNQAMEFIGHSGSGPFGSALAMNTQYEPIRLLRKPIETLIGRSLDYLKSWDSRGEAHVTVITPVEYSKVLRSKLSMAEIEKIALDHKIQSSDIKLLGIGSGRLVIENKMEETYFVLVESLNLRKIRLEIWQEYIKRGGEPSPLFDPSWYFPHITIGYTKRDLHEQDGVQKNLRGSLDRRFQLVVD